MFEFNLWGPKCPVLRRREEWGCVGLHFPSVPRGRGGGWGKGSPPPSSRISVSDQVSRQDAFPVDTSCSRVPRPDPAPTSDQATPGTRHPPRHWDQIVREYWYPSRDYYFSSSISGEYNILTYIHSLLLTVP